MNERNKYNRIVKYKAVILFSSTGLELRLLYRLIVFLHVFLLIKSHSVGNLNSLLSYTPWTIVVRLICYRNDINLYAWKNFIIIIWTYTNILSVKCSSLKSQQVKTPLVTFASEIYCEKTQTYSFNLFGHSKLVS